MTQEDEELPEFVIERGPHGTWTRRRVGFLEAHEALNALARNRQLLPFVNGFRVNLIKKEILGTVLEFHISHGQLIRMQSM